MPQDPSSRLWRDRTGAVHVEEAIEKLAYNAASEEDRAAGRCTLSRLETPVTYSPASVGGLTRAAQLVREAIQNRTPISVFGDYDADGTTASAILYLTLRYLGANISGVRLPRRMSEGYGLCESSIREILSIKPHGLLICVDNGISSADVIRIARSSGMQVVILDHHLPPESGILPDADVLVDQHIPALAADAAEPSCFLGYCGAGLAYQLSLLLLENDVTDAAALLRDQCTALAAIGTVCDMMPLYDDNRAIVRRGLDAIRDGRITDGLNALVSRMNRGGAIDEGFFSFQLGPAINACGRLYDDDAHNAKLPFGVLAAKAASPEGKARISQLADTIVSINFDRKHIVDDAVKRLSPGVDSASDSPIVLFDEQGIVPEGVVGIVAGKFASEYGRSSYVFTKAGSADAPIYKGSARIAGNDHIRLKLDRVHSACPDIFIGYGGHAEAAGVSITIDGSDAFKNCLTHFYQEEGYEGVDTSCLDYDVTIRPEALGEAYSILRRYAPFGIGCPGPVFRVNDIVVSDFFYMGSDKKHVKLHTVYGFDVIGFSLAECYRSIGEPSRVDVVGSITLKDDSYGRVLQLMADDIAPAD